MTNIPRVFRELFIRAGEVFDVGILPLRECLIEVCRSWDELGFEANCPFHFTEEDMREHDIQFSGYKARNELNLLAQECLDTDSEGWIAPQRDIGEKRRQNEELLEQYIERVAGAMAREMWPFWEKES